MEEKPEPIERIKSVFDELSSRFDSSSETLQARVYTNVTWGHLKKYLPEDKNSLILDAGGGTGKWALPLAKMGYRVILCDISKGMLKQAMKKIIKEKVSNRVQIQEENLTNLSYPDQMFDFVLCEDGPISISDSQKVISELGRVLKKEGKIWASVIGRYPLALTEAGRDPEKAHKLCKSTLDYVLYKGIQRNRVFSPQEIQNLFQRNGIEVIKIYGNRILMRSLSKRIQTMTNFGDTFFFEIADMELCFSEDPSLLGMAEYIQIVGKNNQR